MVRSYPNFTTAKSGYIVVNVSLSKLQASLLPMYNPDLTYVRISDGKGDVLLGNDGGSRKINVFSRYISPYTGWEIESGPVNRGFTGLVLKSYNVWMIMAVAAVILGALWVVHVTRRHYKPVSQLVSLIRTSSLIGQDEHPGGNEFGFIRGALERLMEETQKTRQQHNESFILQKRHCFQEALDGTIPIREEKWQADLIKYKINPTGAMAFVQVLEIDRYHEFVKVYNPQDQSILKFVLSSVVQEMAQVSGATAWAEWTADRRLTAIIWVPDERQEDGLDVAISGQIVEWVRSNLSFTVTIGVDGMASSLEEIRRLGENAANLLQYKAVLGSGRTLHPAETESSGFRAHEYFGTIHLLAQSLRLPENNWDKHLNELFAQIRDSVSTRKEIESLVQFLHQHLNRMFSELSKEYRHIWRETEMELAELEQYWETANELHAAYSRIFKQVSHKMQTLRESQRTRVVIGEIRAYIEENFANPELSLEHLSDKFQMHAKNISKLFKEEFGENFVDFLIGLRIGHAKRLLLTTEKPLTVISAEVGYYNYNSFNRAFKNVEGISPSDYRKQSDKSVDAVLPGILLSREKI
jgi:AraC-like DNA-binding protein